MSRLGEAFRTHHRHLREQLSTFAEQIAADPARADIQSLLDFLRNDLLPHAQAEEKHLYPKVAPLLREHGDPTATMQLDHTFIEEHIRAIEAAAGDLSGNGAADKDRLRSEIAGLEALFRAHLEKEERVYLPLVEKHIQEEEQDALLDAMHAGASPETGDAGADEVLDVRELPPPKRHPLIFERFDRLSPGESFVLVNDHDPKPLYYQFAAELAGRFSWEYLEEGPDVWRVRIGKPAS